VVVAVVGAVAVAVAMALAEVATCPPVVA